MVAKWNDIITKDTLIEYIYNEWNKLRGSLKIFESLATSINKRINQVIDRNRNYIEY